MNEWRIYYSDSVFSGRTKEEWLRAPDDDVQAVVWMKRPETVQWTYGVPPTVVRDRQLWTGVSEYDPFGWGVKYGAWMDWDDYMDVWYKACSE